MPVDDPIAVVGVGLMGGSLGLALQSRAGVAEVRGFDLDPAACRAGHDRGAITHACESLGDAVGSARVVFVCSPVGATPDVVNQVLAQTDDGCVVTDIASSKGSVVSAVDAAGRARFIGGHPICGSERGGVEHAREDMFDGATYFLTPSDETRPDMYQRLHGLITRLGATPTAIDAQAHDRILALVSHLPHVIAATLIHQAADTTPHGREALRSAGPSFADLTRVAGANPLLWADILMSNRDAVSDAIAQQRARMESVERMVRDGDREGLERAFSTAAQARERLQVVGEAVHEPWRVLVTMPNQPGGISRVATALGHAHINIEDLDLVSGAGEHEGSLSVIVSGEETARTAEQLLTADGFEVESAPVTLD